MADIRKVQKLVNFIVEMEAPRQRREEKGRFCCSIAVVCSCVGHGER